MIDSIPDESARMRACFVQGMLVELMPRIWQACWLILTSQSIEEDRTNSREKALFYTIGFMSGETTVGAVIGIAT